MSKCINILIDSGYSRAEATQVCMEIFSNLGYVNLVLFVESVQKRGPRNVDKV